MLSMNMLKILICVVAMLHFCVHMFLRILEDCEDYSGYVIQTSITKSAHY